MKTPSLKQLLTLYYEDSKGLIGEVELRQLTVSQQNLVLYPHDWLLLHRLFVSSKWRRKGFGESLLSEVCGFADRIGKHLLLRVVPFAKNGCSARKLRAIYRGHGFTTTRDLPGCMIRKAPE